MGVGGAAGGTHHSKLTILIVFLFMRKEKKKSSHLPSEGLYINTDNLKTDSQTYILICSLLESLQENQYYNFALKTFCSHAKGRGCRLKGQSQLPGAAGPSHDTGAERPLAAKWRQARRGAARLVRLACHPPEANATESLFWKVFYHNKQQRLQSDGEGR